jgi:hypothetical protein
VTLDDASAVNSHRARRPRSALRSLALRLSHTEWGAASRGGLAQEDGVLPSRRQASRP